MCANLAQAEEITLAIGQAFDLAYKKFLESGGKDVETRKQIGNLQKRVRLCSWITAHKMHICAQNSSFSHKHAHFRMILGYFWPCGKYATLLSHTKHTFH